MGMCMHVVPCCLELTYEEYFDRILKLFAVHVVAIVAVVVAIAFVVRLTPDISIYFDLYVFVCCIVTSQERSSLTV